MSSFWTEERKVCGLAAEQVVRHYDAQSTGGVAGADEDSYTLGTLADDRDDVLEFAVQKTPNGENMRPLFRYWLDQASVVVTLREKTPPEELVAIVVGIELPMTMGLGKVLFSTMLTVRALDRETGLVQRFMRSAFRLTASMGFGTWLFTSDKPIKAPSLTAMPMLRRVFPFSKPKDDPALQLGRAAADLDEWVRRLAATSQAPVAGIDWRRLTPAQLANLLCHSSVFTARFNGWQHAAVCMNSGTDFVHMLFYCGGDKSDKDLLRFLRALAGKTQRSIVIDCCSEALALTKMSEIIREETRASASVPDGYRVFAHNLPCASLERSLPLVNLPMW